MPKHSPTVACIMLLAVLVTRADLQMATAQSAEGTTVDFDAISFILPGQGWQRTDHRGGPVPQVQFVHKQDDRRLQSLGIWPVIFPPSLQGRSQQDHALAYFTIERQKPR